MKVKDCMCNKVAYVDPRCSVEQCAKIMNENHIGCLPVCDNTKKVVGLVTDRDILLRTVGCGKDAKTTPVGDIMTANVFSCNPEQDINTAQKVMAENQIRRLPVIENNKIVGILTLGDLAKNLNVSTEGVATTLENICGYGNKNAE